MGYLVKVFGIVVKYMVLLKLFLGGLDFEFFKLVVVYFKGVFI